MRKKMDLLHLTCSADPVIDRQTKWDVRMDLEGQQGLQEREVQVRLKASPRTWKDNKVRKGGRCR